ncbi:hypothetical protein FCG40_04535 [Fimbriimonadia bacterium ATM]|nr:MAG: hypothetical protein EDM73_02170 [Armatimonadota bacterium]MBC6968698.1 hypothetical protein [Armatimonadota bacterium]MCE7898463.1 hypothetical protein [Armatimonadetes bacterium ATM1]MDL1928244.1 hypothetical protein [Fimbriimonadia bacterium ATM]RIJ98198.1 MAG: hypothetical protein DCC45_00035 [Armatimonadota bacterium]
MRGIALILIFVLSAAASAANLIVRLAPGADPIAVANDYGLGLTDETEPAPFYLYDTLGQDPHLIQQQMIGDPRIVWAEDDNVVVMPEHHGAGMGSTIGAVYGTNFYYQENSAVLSQIRWLPPMRLMRGRNVRVAILDTGLGQRQFGLWLRVVASLNTVETGQPPFDAPRGHDTNGNGVFDEGTGHGTMVAGIVTIMWPPTGLVIVRIADSDGYSTAWRLIKGLAFAWANGSELANVSLGAIDNVPALNDVLDWCEEVGLLVVAAIGNNGQRLALTPARNSKAVCVTGVLPDDVRAPFSNWEGAADAAAPATGIKSYWWDGTAGIWSGTSFAAPFVTGAIASGLAYSPPRTPEFLRDAVRVSGDNIDPLNPGFEDQLGSRLNMARLVQIIRQ